MAMTIVELIDQLTKIISAVPFNADLTDGEPGPDCRTLKSISQEPGLGITMSFTGDGDGYKDQEALVRLEKLLEKQVSGLHEKVYLSDSRRELVSIQHIPPVTVLSFSAEPDVLYSGKLYSDVLDSGVWSEHNATCRACGSESASHMIRRNHNDYEFCIDCDALFLINK